MWRGIYFASSKDCYPLIFSFVKTASELTEAVMLLWFWPFQQPGRAAALPIRLRHPIRPFRVLRLFEELPLPLFLFGKIDALAAEPAPAHFGDGAHGEEGVGVDLLHFVFEPHQLARGDDGEEHIALLAQIPRLAVEHGDAAVEVVQDHLSDLGIAVADDLDLHLALPQ